MHQRPGFSVFRFLHITYSTLLFLQLISSSRPPRVCYLNTPLRNARLPFLPGTAIRKDTRGRIPTNRTSPYQHNVERMGASIGVFRKIRIPGPDKVNQQQTQESYINQLVARNLTLTFRCLWLNFFFAVVLLFRFLVSSRFSYRAEKKIRKSENGWLYDKLGEQNRPT